jgi:hypothetical protein
LVRPAWHARVAGRVVECHLRLDFARLTKWIHA